jgi:hypothetical protein
MLYACVQILSYRGRLRKSMIGRRLVLRAVGVLGVFSALYEFASIASRHIIYPPSDTSVPENMW